MNPESIDALYARWQENPDVSETIVLCEALRGSERHDLVEIVGSHAARQLDVGALIAAARMYVGSRRLEDAQTVLLAAGRIAPREGAVYRWLGEVLLRRGDAERAERVLEKAVQLSDNDPDASMLIERARALITIQVVSGHGAVADEVARIGLGEVIQARTAAQPKVPPPAQSSGRRLPAPSAKSPLVPHESDDSADTVIRRDVAPLTPPPPLAAPPPSVPPPPFNLPKPPPPDDMIFQTPTRGVGFTPQAPSSGGDLGILPKSAPQLTANASTAAFGSAGSLDAPPSSRGRPAPPREPPINPLLQKQRARSADGTAIPEARDVLEALQVAGIFEPDATASPQTFVWAKPEGVRRLLTSFTLLGLAALLVVGGIGSYYYVTAKRAREHLVAETMLSQIDHDLASSNAALLDPAEKNLSHVFELESRSPHAALTWVRERAIVGLLKGGADLAFEDSVQRAKEVGVDEKKVAFAHVASFLFQGDTAGAAGTVAKWDSGSQDDPWFQLLAGATFERAGDSRALERYATAAKLDPDLLIVRILLTRATAVDGDPKRAAELAKEFRAKYPDRPEGAALVALAWTRDPLRGDPPPEVEEVTKMGDALPPSLRAVPQAARAMVALHHGSYDEARPALQKGLDLADSPGIAAWLGSIALTMGDENLARKAALTAVSFSAVYPPARVLAARVALLGARLDEALKATEDLPQGSADVAIVTAAASYEKLDGERMGRAFDAVSEDPRKLPFGIPLGRGQALLAGNAAVMTGAQALDMADDEAPWADLVAMDWALDVGDLDLAKKIADPWKTDMRALRAVRLARLARYDNRLEDADKFSKIAIEGGTVTMRVLAERVFTLVQAKRDAEAIALFKSYPNVGGPLAKWLRAYAVAAHGKLDEARAIVAQEDPPPAAAPMPARVIAAMAFAMMKDAHHGSEYTKPIAQAGFANPDVAFAAEKVGAGKPVRRGK